ncbi:hypothetical protein TrST_g13868 [Triparma strigata]|uniref:TRP C-terminal domain-containing protein n=1 Tax=Triparma strigata TaxID=1606541 RepID=A0A9W7EI86_9STRA|nr:hypothetical protein TrST_g13868 [Triparma strigata]
MTGASNVTGCEPCKTDVGEYSPAGSGYCLSCTSGTYYDEEQNACFDCPVGRFTATGGIGLSGCEFCPEGFYSSTTGSPTCFACQPGKYVNALNSTCVECEPGHFSGVASSSCSACEQGKFADGVGNAECTKCPDFQTSEKGSSACVCKKTFKTINRDSSELECTCDPGMMLDNGVCVPCATGFFKSSTSLEGCKNCDKHAIKGAIQSYKGPIESSEPANSPLSCICSKGEFRSLKSNETLIGSCQSCPEGTKCDHAGVTMRDLPINRGYWRSNFTSSNIVKCYIKQACPQSPSTKTINSTNPIDEQCADGHTGPICNLCLQGYAKDFLGNCITCEDDRFHIPTETAAILVTLGVVFIASVYFYKRKKKESRDRLQEFRERKSESSTTSRVTNSLVAAQVNRDHWFYRVRTKGKIMLSFSQILTSFEGVLEVRFPSIFENFMRMISSVANLNAIQLARIDCLVRTNFYTKLLVQTIVPLGVSALILLCYLLAKFSKRFSRESLSRLADTSWSAFLTLTYIVFASVSTTVFDTFNCGQFGDDPHLWLARDHSIDCRSPQHVKYKTYASVMVFIYPLGIPALYATVLFRSRKKLRRVDRDFDPTIQKTSFLWQNYELDKWWFEVFECARRLGMSGILVFVAQGTASQIVVGLLISAFTSGLYIHWRPFERESDDDLAIVTQVSLFFTLLAALLTKVEIDKTDDYNELIFGYMLIVVNCSSVALLILSQLSKPIHFWFGAVVGKQHRHEGSLRGMNKE